jgi:hypothetical protein
MFFPKLRMSVLGAGAGIAAAALLATPSQAVITTFAGYTAVSTAENIYWKNNGSGSSNGTGGSIYTISSASSTLPGTTQISFSFLQGQLSPVTNVLADFWLSATVTNSPAVTAAGFKIEPLITGSFQILSTSVITIGGHTFGAGSILLAGSFNEASIFGASGSTSGSFTSATSSGATITYTSDFLDFLPTVDRDFSLSLTAIAQPLFSSSNRALRTFKAVSTGSFSSDPAPTPVVAVPEAATWAMFIGGFGFMGAALRRRRVQHSLV